VNSMTNINNGLIRKLLLITIAYFCFFIVFPSYLYAPNSQFYVPLLDYSSFNPGSKAGGDIELLVNFTKESPFSPLLKGLVYTTLDIFKDPYLVIQLVYKLITFANLIIFISLIYLFKDNLNVIFILLISVISYPFIHEIERGQWNFICSALIFAGILTKIPVVAFLCFTLAFQLKIFPLLFLPLLLNRRFFRFKFIIFFAMVNIGLFSILGLDEFIVFINTQILNSSVYVDGWEMNPSIDSFIHLLGTVLGYKIPHILKWLLLVPILGSIFLQTRKMKTSTDEKNIFLLISIFIVLAIPLSYDYRLSILIIPFAWIMSCPKYSNLSKSTLEKCILYFIYLYLMVKVSYVAHGFVSFTKHLYPFLSNSQSDMLSQLLGSRFLPLYALWFCFILVIHDDLFYKKVYRK
jgi:hypothetical protein